MPTPSCYRWCCTDRLNAPLGLFVECFPLAHDIGLARRRLLPGKENRLGRQKLLKRREVSISHGLRKGALGLHHLLTKIHAVRSRPALAASSHEHTDEEKCCRAAHGADHAGTIDAAAEPVEPARPCGCYCMCWPPLMAIFAPVTKAASSLAR